MAVPWLVVGQLVLGNLDKIIRVVKPAFTKRVAQETPPPLDLVSKQIAELQTAAANNAEQIGELATQLKDVVAAMAQAASDAQAQRDRIRRQSQVATVVSVLALVVAIIAASSARAAAAGVEIKGESDEAFSVSHCSADDRGDDTGVRGAVYR